MSRIAVLSSYYVATMFWLLDEHLKDVPRHEITLHQSRKQIHTRNNTYIVVSNREQIYGYEFNDFIVAPDYVDLKDVLRSRIKP